MALLSNHSATCLFELLVTISSRGQTSSVIEEKLLEHALENIQTALKRQWSDRDIRRCTTLAITQFQARRQELQEEQAQKEILDGLIEAVKKVGEVAKHCAQDGKDSSICGGTEQCSEQLKRKSERVEELDRELRNLESLRKKLKVDQ